MEIFKLFGSIFVDSDAADKSIKKTGENAEGFAAKLGNGIKTAAKWGAAIVAAAGTAAIAIGTKAVVAASNFETSFAQVNTLLSDTVNIDAYKKAIIDLSNRTGVATDSLCESIYSAISASVEESEAIKFVESALKLAEGGFTDAATAVDVMTTAINAYGLSAEDAAQVSDYLIMTQNLGKTTVNELATSLGKVIPIASAYGVTMDDLSANMAILTKNGIATAEATTYTKAMLNELGDSGSDVSEILQEKTGKTFGELKESGLSLGEIIAILGDSVENDSAAFNELWSSSEAGVGALTLLKTGAEEYNTVLDAMRDSAGATTEAYETMHNTFAVKVDQLKTVVTNALVEIGNTLLPFATSIVDWVIENMPLIQSIVQAVIGVLQSTVEGFCDIVQGIFLAIQGSLESAGVTFDDVMSTIQGIFSAAWDFMVLAWNCIGQPLLDLMMDAFGWLLENWTTITGAIEDVFSLLWSMAEAVWSTLGQPLFDSMADTMAWLSEHWDEITGIIQDAFGILWELCGTLWAAVGQPVFDLIGFVVEELAGLFNEHLDDILAFFQQAMEGIKDTWENHLKPIFDAIGAFLREVLMPAFEFVFKTIIEPLVENVFSVIADLWNNSLKPIFDGICDFLLGVFTGDWEQALTGILNIVTGIFNGIKSVVVAVMDGIKSTTTSVWNGVKTAVTTAVNDIKSKVTLVFDVLKTTVTSVWTNIKNAISTPINAARDTVKSAIDKIKGFFNFEWSLPKLKLPHPKISGSFSLNPPSVPSFGIDWYAKGGVLEEPTIFGMNPENGNAMVGGEAGPEAVAPIETLQQYVREAVDSQNQKVIEVLIQILGAITSMDQGLLEKMLEALKSFRFEIKEREFARLVREV